MSQNISAEVLDRFCESIRDNLGLRCPAERRGEVERALAGAAKALHADAEQLARRLTGGTWKARELEAVAAELTVGETYFLREPNVLEAARETVLPELVRKRRAKRELRVWSAGCCTGEEPYTIAILITQIIPDWREWRIRILATDVNPTFLREARRGIYRRWSFRQTTPAFRSTYFTPASGGLEIRPELRRMVSFAQLNLAQEDYPSWENQTAEVDLIFCRNVLMYFDPQKAREAVSRIHASLADGGWLIVSPAELSQELFASFLARNFAGSTIYCKCRKPVRAHQPAFPEPQWDSAATSDPQGGRLEVGAVRTPAADVPLKTQTESGRAKTGRAQPRVESAEVAAQVRACANQGELSEASQWCEKGLARFPHDPVLHYLRAVVLQEQGMYEQAVVSLRRALYMDPKFVLAYVALANVRSRQGKGSASRKYRGAALGLLASYEAQQVIPESEGITAEALTEMLRQSQEQWS